MKVIFEHFGDYVQASFEKFPKNNNSPRSIDAINLRTDDYDQGDHQVIDLTRGKMVSQPYAKKMFMTQMVKKRVEEMVA